MYGRLAISQHQIQKRPQGATDCFPQRQALRQNNSIAVGSVRLPPAEGVRARNGAPLLRVGVDRAKAQPARPRRPNPLVLRMVEHIIDKRT